MSIKDITEKMVLSAIAEFDQTGRDAMLAKYSSGPSGRSTRWYVQHNGEYYDQKLILRAAHQLGGLGSIPPGRGTFKANEARKQLRSLGFKIGEKL